MNKWKVVAALFLHKLHIETIMQSLAFRCPSVGILSCQILQIRNDLDGGIEILHIGFPQIKGLSFGFIKK